MLRHRWLVAGVLALALVVRLGYVALTPHYIISLYDARDYDAHAQAIAATGGMSLTLTGKPTAFRPPGYPYLLGAAYKLTGATAKEDRIHTGRILGCLLGTWLVGMIGLLAHRFWGRRTSLVAMLIAALYLPLITISTAVMSETLFTSLLIGCLLLALSKRVVLAGLVAGVAILTRANGLALLLPLCFAVWDWKPKGLLKPAVLAACACLVVAPWTIRNYIELHHFVPVTTQFGTALAGTYNDTAAHDTKNPASWRWLPRIPSEQYLLVNWHKQNEAELEDKLRTFSENYIKAHPTYVAKVWWWNTRRALELASWSWSRHTYYTVMVPPGWANAAVVSFWIVGLLAVAGMFTRAARIPPWYVWAVPVLMYFSVVFTAFETPRYRTPLEPFIICLAALALTRGRGAGERSGEAAHPGSAPRHAG